MSRRYPVQITGVAVVAVAVLGVAACSSSPSKSSGSGKKTVELITGNATDPFYITMACGAMKEAAKLGVSLKVQGPTSFSVPLQKPIIDNAEVTKPDALVVAPTDDVKLDSDLQKIASNGTKIILVDTSVLNKSIGLSRISSNNVQGGQVAADSLGASLGGKGTVGVISMAKGTSTTDQRVQGFIAEMKSKYPNIKLLPEQNDIAATTTQATTFAEGDITADPHLSGIFAANTVTAEGVAAGIQHAGKIGSVKLVTFDAEPVQVQMLNGGVAQTIIAQEPALEGEDGVIQAVNAIEGKHVTANIPTPLTAITKANVNDPNVKPLIYKSSLTGC
ncbi:MAG TPA: ABC transporter substrate-binding protein [Streptosporangiaceae bacterium]|jgi:ribose transport system substrate-binding protein|nr:ABC transporter substrate-binding protein [Streptosporangiaceae bacterium]